MGVDENSPGGKEPFFERLTQTQMYSQFNDERVSMPSLPEIRFFEVETDRDYQRELRANKYRGDAKGRIEEWLIDKLSGLIPDWMLQPEDLNTDGIDPSGIDFYIHDVKIYNDDDSIAVKPSQSGSISPCIGFWSESSAGESDQNRCSPHPAAEQGIRRQPDHRRDPGQPQHRSDQGQMVSSRDS